MGGKGALAVLLVVALGAGGFNYHRNWSAEAEEAPRPYRGYGDDDLAALVGAYEQEVAALQERYDAARAAPRAEGRGQLLGEQVRDFERARARGDALRQLAADVAEREAVLRELHREQSLRTGASGLALHVKRLLTI